MSTMSDALPGYPDLTLGTLGLSPAETVGTIHEAIALGYRAFDTAPIYGNEDAVGEALRSAPVARDELFLTTKLWNSCHGYDEALAAFDRTVGRLQLEVVDLYLVHWPVPTQGRYVESWKALVRLHAEGRVKAIGVSNFLSEHLVRIIDATGVVPAVNQIEIHPSFSQSVLCERHRELGIITQAWSPLGNGQDLADPRIASIAATHGRSAAQIILQWHLQSGVAPVVKARGAGHLRENLLACDFQLSCSELDAIGTLDTGVSAFGLDPRTFVAPEGFEDFHP